MTEIFPRRDAKSDLVRLGWPPNPMDLATRYAVLLSAIDFDQYSVDRPLKLLDVGCGLGLLLDYLTANSLIGLVDYIGVDLDEAILQEAQARWPGHHFRVRDVQEEPYESGAFDYCIICGIFTCKIGNNYDVAVASAQSILKAVWPSVKVGLAFNSMSKHVDWERDDLFHWPLDDIMKFCKCDLGRHVSFYLDYGLWEMSTLIRKAPRRPHVNTPWG